MLNDEINPRIWDEIWLQESTTKQFKLLLKKLHLYLDLSNLLNASFKYIDVKHPLILELGCGGSPFFSYLQNKLQPYQIYGIDRSLKAAELLKNNLEDTNSANIICGDIFNFPFKEKKFDIVCSFGFIEHFQKPKKALKLHKKLLKSGGLLICIIPNLYGLSGKILNLLECETVTKISISDLNRWIHELDFEKINVKPAGGLYPSLFLDSYSHESNKFNENMIRTLHKNILTPISVSLNIPFLFRINSNLLSPFILGYGIKS